MRESKIFAGTDNAAIKTGTGERERETERDRKTDICVVPVKLSWFKFGSTKD